MAASAFETGHSFFAVCAICSNVAASMPGTWPSVSPARHLVLRFQIEQRGQAGGFGAVQFALHQGKGDGGPLRQGARHIHEGRHGGSRKIFPAGFDPLTLERL